MTGKLTLCNTQCQSCPCNGPLQQGSKLPSGWFWNTNGGPLCDNDCSPSTQFGIGQVVSNIYFCTELHVKTFATQNEFETNKNLRFNFQTTTDGATGCWEDPIMECTRDYAQIGPDWVIDDSTDQTNTLALFVYEDVYKNGLYDNDDDFALKNCAITIVGSDTTFFTNSFGKVFLHLENGTYIIRYQMNYGDWENDVIEKTIIVSDLNQHDSLGFAPSVLNYSGNVIVGSNFLRCNTEVPIFVAASNTSNYTFDGYISLHIDPSLQINSGIPEPDFNSLNVLNWNFDNLRPGKSVYSKAFVNIPNQMTNADSLRFSGYLISSSGDTLSTFYYVSIIRCSYDPNDKRSWPDRIGNENYTLKSEKLDYTIRFQNNGNDTAYYVRIVDVLDNGVDKHSLFIKASSHQVETFMIGDTLNFVFDNIFLPDSTTNFRASQGYISFSLSSKKDIVTGSVITNKASIYFDKNLPIITNNVVNTIVDSLPCPLKNIWLEDNAIRVNPGGNSFKWYDCNTDLLVNTSLVAAYTPSFSGSFYAEIKGDHCTVRTECISFGLSSLDHDSQPMIKVYPNPTNGAFYISTSFKVLSVSAFDLLGNAVPLFTELGQANDSKFIFNNCIPGAYILAIQTSNRLYHTKVTIVK
ncbi:MAG: T9SS type A sorting domain-containing protein [Saprospiraceae bacterium]|nr:T9SS type A sorting domain-containing protein [Saprospiraceae bacterium]